MPSTLRRDVLELDQTPLLPRLDAGYVRALNRLLDRRRNALELTLPLDTMTLRWLHEPVLPRAATAGNDAYRFRLGAHAGWLLLESAGVAALLREPRAELLPRELRYVLLAEALHPAIERLERQYRVRFEWLPDGDDAQRPAPTASTPGAPFVLRGLDTGIQVAGLLCFDQLAAFDAHVPPLPAGATPPVAPVLERLRFPLGFCLGHTRIQLREVREIHPGDIVGLETWGPRGSALRVVAQVGGAQGLHLSALAEGSRITLQSMKGKSMNRDPQPDALEGGDDGVPDDKGVPTLARLDGLEVTLRFEVGELAVSLGELKSLRAGHVFELPHPLNRSTVRILAHGNVLGKGQLVAVGDRLGVRVAEFATTEL